MPRFPSDGRSPLLGGVAAILLGVVVFLLVRRRFDRTITALVDTLSANQGATVDHGGPEANATAGGSVTERDLGSLPPPVGRYLNTVLGEDQRYVESVRLTQRGEFRLGDSSTSWKPFRATQHFSVRPPGFVWDATVEMVPRISVRVVDAYSGGEGFLRARLLSAIPVADAESGHEMNEGELLRYLGESVWFPTALLSDDIEWEAIDDRSARATIEHRGTSASLVFRFDENDFVKSVHAEGRYRQEDDRSEPWTGYFRNYRERNGLLIPVDAEVEWNLPEGDHPYWRATIEEIDHRFYG